MPNWCHDTLTVHSRDEAAVQRWAEAAMPTEAQLTAEFNDEPDHPSQAKTMGGGLAAYMAEQRAVRPLSFASIVPEPSADEYQAMVDAAERKPCDLCAGTGKRPGSPEEAEEMGVHYHEVEGIHKVPYNQRPQCNGCAGTGEVLVDSFVGWYNWRLQNWGTKWDASFSGPVGAIAADEADVEASVDAQGVQVTKYVVIYKFDTAWSPPVPFVQKASEQFPELDFELTFGEVGHDFAGRISFRAGEVLHEEELKLEDVLMPEEQWF